MEPRKPEAQSCQDGKEIKLLAPLGSIPVILLLAGMVSDIDNADYAEDKSGCD